MWGIEQNGLEDQDQGDPEVVGQVSPHFGCFSDSRRLTVASDSWGEGETTGQICEATPHETELHHNIHLFVIVIFIPLDATEMRRNVL